MRNSDQLLDPQNKPIIVQSDHSILLEVQNPNYALARDQLGRFAELEKSPEYFHTYRITPISLWNAAAAGTTAEEIIAALEKFSRYQIPSNVIHDIKEFISRYGKIKLLKEKETLYLKSEDPILLAEIFKSKAVAPFLRGQVKDDQVEVEARFRGHLKQALIRIGYPVEDLAGYKDGTYLNLQWRSETLSGGKFFIRDYQNEAITRFWMQGQVRGGSGVIVLPCGAGKTLVGIGAMEKLKCQTLVIVTSLTAVHQWREELLQRTNLSLDQIGEYTSLKKEILPITLTTYQMLTYRKSVEDDFPHFKIMTKPNWGLVIYDEVHLLPAPVFRITAEIQARRRLGLTATLIREDGHEVDVFSLVGPKKYDVPWKELENQGWIAQANCFEIRVDLPTELRRKYAASGIRNRYRIASENPEKLKIVKRLIIQHKGDQALIIGQYIQQLKQIAAMLNLPLITGSVKDAERQQLYNSFRAGKIKALVVSKVANFAVDLPDANVAIQVSGTFGSRQEEAQRLGRILRPKSDGSQANFYTIVTRNTRDQEFSEKRQLFLTEQGYRYFIKDAHDFL